MKTGFRDVLIVWKNDWLDLYRSRLTAFWLCLYLLGALSSSLFFVFIVSGIENKVAHQVNLAETEKAGAMTSSLQQSRQFRDILEGLVGDKELARQFADTPLLALFFGWMTLTFAPFLVIMLSSESISTDVSTGAARFSLFRTSRLSWVMGKAFSQASLILLSIVLSAITVWIVGRFRISAFEPLTIARYLAWYSVRAWIYSLSFLGLGLAVSQMIRSVQLSRALGIVLFFATVIIFRIADHYSGDGIARLWELVVILLPQGHRLDFWRPGFLSQFSAFAFSIGLGFLYFMGGFALFSRKDI